MSAYIVSVCEITNMNDDFKRYVQRAEALIHQAGGEYIVRGPANKIYEGEKLQGRYVIIVKFPNMAALQSFIDSDEYVNEVKPLRAGTGIYDIGVWEETAQK